MEKRLNEKIPVNIYANIIFGDKTYHGYIENIAQEDAEYLMVLIIKVSENFKPERIAEVHFKIPSGETLKLHCKIIMFFKSLYDNGTEVLGMEVINPPLKFKEFIASLNISTELVKPGFDIDNVDHEDELSYNQTHYEVRKKVHIIIAEDDIDDQKMALSILERPDYTVEVANNGEEVLEGLKKQHTDIVLMDIHMPKMDGIEATQAIRNSKDNVFNAEIPIIAVTAQAFEEEKERCLKAGMNSYVTKPIKREELYKEISTLTQAEL